MGDITMELRTPGTDGNFTNTTDLQLLEYFNRVHCECDSEFQVRYQLADGVDPNSLNGEQVDIYFGSMCDDSQRQPECLIAGDALPDFGDLQTLLDVNYSVRDIITLQSGSCSPDDTRAEGSNSIFALVDVEGDGAYESVSSQPVSYDIRPPTLPDNIELRGGEEAIVISFDLPSANDDLYQYQVLCARVDDPSSPVKTNPPTAAYDRVEDLEGCASTFQIPVEGNGPDVPPALGLLDPAFLCGEGASSASSIRVDGVENEVAYHAVLVTVDRQRNAQAIYLGTVEPRPAVDFWELYERSGGSADGGCQTSTAGSWLGFLLVLGVALALMRRRRAVALVLALVVPATASAQPYWEELQEPVETIGKSVPAWNVGLKFGPYTPDVDAEFSGEGPFERTFGSKDGLMSQLDVERFFLYPLGQLGLAATLGFHAKSAKAFEERNGELVRIPDGERTGFKLIPTALSAVYRFTHLDDRYGIPLVPYGKVGLAYYTWWVTKPGGDLAETGSGKKARGGSLGWQGSVGLALRAERLDRTAAQSLSNEFGVEHAGLYAELSVAQVDGFGSDSKLSVGDTTWFAGVNFEF